MKEKTNVVELNEDNLEKVAGGNETAMPIGTEEKTDRAILENLTDNKGADK